MHINHTFKVNSFSVEKGVVSVTYTPTDASLALKPFHIQQLGIHKQDMIDYSAGVIDVAEFQLRMRKAIVAASTLPVYEWNETLKARELQVPEEVSSMLGIEWAEVTEEEVTENVSEVL